MFTALMIVQFLVSIALIVIVLLQKSKGEGLGSIGGGAQMFFHRAKGWEALLERATTLAATLFMVLSIVLAFLSARL